MTRTTRGSLRDHSRWIAAPLALAITSLLFVPRADAQPAVVVEAEVVPPPPAAAAPQVAAPPPTQAVLMAPSPPPQVVYAPVQQAPQQQYVYSQPQTDARPAGRGLNLGPIIGGAVMLGVSWISNIIVSLFAGVHVSLGFGGGGSGSGSEWERFRYAGLVPVVGPWVQLGLQPTGFGQDGWGPWLVIDGLLQAAGLTMLIVGITSSGGDDDPAPSAERERGLQLSLVPSVAPERAGLTLLGQF